MLPRLSLLVICLAIAGAGVAVASPPRVAVSIVAVHSLVAAVGEGVLSAELIVKGGGSPHTYALRPSEARLLQETDLVFWIGKDLETFLVKPLRTLPAKARAVALAAAPGVHLLPYRAEDGFADDDHHDHDHDHAHHHDAAAGRDMHVWLDPRNARAMADAIVTALAESDPANAERYRANGTRLRDRLDALERAIGADLAAIRDRPFVVFHDAYQYFEHRFGLKALGAVTLSPERQPGAKRLAAIRARIRTSGAVCVFAEPQFPPALVGTVVEGTGARTGVLDPLGAGLAPGADAYAALLNGLARAFADCLGGGAAR